MGLCGARWPFDYIWVSRNPYGYVVSEGRQGVMVTCIVQNGPLAAAGLLPRTIISAVDGKQVLSSGDLEEALSDRAPGEQIYVTTVQAPGPGNPVSRSRNFTVRLKQGLPEAMQ
jgi:S1-C subfamily serine protease